MAYKSLWRRGWDSNPRYTCAYSGFRDRPVQPLWHLSGVAYFSRLIKAAVRGSWIVVSACRLDGLQSAHVGLQDGRDCHAPVRALIVFHDRDQRAADGKTGAVERVYELGFALF